MDFQKITDYLKSLEEYGVPSTDMMIYKDHELIYRNFNGFTDENKSVTVSDDTQYLMFSMTKVQTMTALMQLVERGVLSLDDEVSKYLPAYKELTAIDNNSIVKVNSLKLWQLASMQSGLDYDLERPGIVRVLKEKGASATTKELVDSFVESPLSFIPGTHYQYSLSHDVIAAVIEVASGMKFSEYLKKNMLQNSTYPTNPQIKLNQWSSHAAISFPRIMKAAARDLQAAPKTTRSSATPSHAVVFQKTAFAFSNPKRLKYSRRTCFARHP